MKSTSVITRVLIFGLFLCVATITISRAEEQAINDGLTARMQVLTKLFHLTPQQQKAIEAIYAARGNATPTTEDVRAVEELLTPEQLVLIPAPVLKQRSS